MSTVALVLLVVGLIFARDLPVIYALAFPGVVGERVLGLIS